MNIYVIDQSASQLRSHRVLYVLKLFRASFLNVAIILTAVVLFAVGDVHFYPLGIHAIEAIETAMASLRIYGGRNFAPLIIATVLIVGTITFLFFLWIYISITKVSVKALRFQSVLLMMFSLFLWAGDWHLIVYSLAKLSRRIFIFGGLVPCYVHFFSARRSYSPSSCVTFARAVQFCRKTDRRLTRGKWEYANKLLDLPRTPFRSWRTVAAYALGLVGTLYPDGLDDLPDLVWRNTAEVGSTLGPLCS